MSRLTCELPVQYFSLFRYDTSGSYSHIKFWPEDGSVKDSSSTYS